MRRSVCLSNPGINDIDQMSCSWSIAITFKENHRDGEIIVTPELINGKRLRSTFWGTHTAYSPFIGIVHTVVQTKAKPKSNPFLFIVNAMSLVTTLNYIHIQRNQNDVTNWYIKWYPIDFNSNHNPIKKKNIWSHFLTNFLTVFCLCMHQRVKTSSHMQH